MSSHRPKVVPLSSTRQSPPQTPLRSPSQTVVELHQRSKQRLMALLLDMFDNTDDALFELADKAENNIEQSLYFESMREVRIQRRGIETRFAQAIDEGFRQISQDSTPVTTEPVTLASVSEESLSIVAQDELEEIVAIDGMISKAMGSYSAALSHLTTRMNSLVAAKIGIKNNPLGPLLICRALADSFVRVDIDIKAKLLIFKLFDKYVMSRLGDVLADANQLLISAGILPRLDPDMTAQKRPRHQIGTQHEVPDNHRTAPAQDDEVFVGLQHLLNRTTTRAGQDRMSGGSIRLLPVGKAPAMPRSLIMELLSELQAQQLQDFQQVEFAAMSAECIDIPNLLDQILVSREVKEQQSLGKVDDDVINLVQMLFQFILDDRNLAATMKALIARLQIPMIKVAMQDKSFFSRGGHPARKLLNEIATSALGWAPAEQEESKDPLLEKVENTVSQILGNYNYDMQVFQDLLDDFTSFRETEKRRIGLIEKRMVAAEDGKAKSEQARAAVQQLIDEKMAGRCLPEVVVHLLRDAWSNVLFLVYLREGAGSSEWKKTVAVVDELLWSVQEVDRQALLKGVPGLLKKLREGLVKISFDNFAMNKMFSELEAEHLKRLKGKSAAAAIQTNQAVTPPTFEAETIVAHEGVDEGDDSKSVSFVEPSADQQLSASIGQVDQASYDKVEALTMGTWVECRNGDEGKFRCRLAAIIRPTGKYIFVNRSGKKVAEYSRDGLAGQLQVGNICLLDDGLLFDRALESVIGNLRDLKKHS